MKAVKPLSMISKVKTGAGFKGAVSYVMNKKDAELINKQAIYGDQPQQIAAEMKAVAASREVAKPVLHVSLSLPPGVKATNEQWKMAAETYLTKMGFDLGKTQYLIARHNDTEHDHIHIIANRVQLDGKLVSDRHSYRRSHQATAEAARNAGLENLHVNQKETSHSGRLNSLRNLIDGAVTQAKSWKEFERHLESKGIALKFNRSQTTGRISGLSYVTADGRSWKASALGKSYTLNGLSRRGLEAGNSLTRHKVSSDKATFKSGTKIGSGLNLKMVDDKRQRSEIDKWNVERSLENERTEAEQDRAAQEAEFDDEM